MAQLFFLLLTLSIHCITTHTAYERLFGEPLREEHKQPLLPQDNNQAQNHEPQPERNRENAHQEAVPAPEPEPTLPLCDYCSERVPKALVFLVCFGSAVGFFMGIFANCQRM